LASGDYDDALKPSQANGSTLKHQADNMSPPPAPALQNNILNAKGKQSVHIALLLEQTVMTFLSEMELTI